MKRIGIIAALPGELKPLVRGWKQIPVADRIYRWEFKLGDTRWIAVCAGMGRSAATRAFAEAEREGQLAAVLSVGWAGGLRAGFVPGQVCNVSHIFDTQTGEQFQLASSDRTLTLLTTARVADHQSKRRLTQAYPQAALVDMEAAAVARMAAARNIPCYCFKAVSDGFEDRLPDLNAFIDASGQFLTAKFVLSALFKPGYWRSLALFGDNSRKAADNLAKTVGKFLLDEGCTRANS